jgi:hypothetical protein
MPIRIDCCDNDISICYLLGINVKLWDCFLPWVPFLVFNSDLVIDHGNCLANDGSLYFSEICNHI